MKKTGWLIGVLVLIGVAAVLAANWLRNQADNQPVVAKSNTSKQESEPAPKPKPPIPKDYVEVGGVARPKIDVQRPEVVTPAENFERPSPGKVPLVDPKANENVKSVHEALVSKDPKLAYRTSVMIPAPEFNKEEYLADPEKYLNEIAPGRIWQSLDMAEGATPIVRSGQYITEVLQGESVNLETKVDPGMPVTFHSPRLGQFENQLSVISVRADANGIARATFKASTGTQGDIDIFATSPVHSGRARFLVSVVLPKKPGAAAPEGDSPIKEAPSIPGADGGGE